MKANNLYIDIDAISDFINGENPRKSSSTDINEMYEADEEGKLKLVSKSVSESKVDTENDKTIRYTILTQLMEAIDVHDDEGDDFGTSLKMNTLFAYGIIKEGK
jgi:hypothetical protein